MNMDRYAHIVGWGSYLPERTLSNAEIARFVNTSDEWIETRTGIKQRHIATKETTTTMGYQAAVKALTVAGISPSQVELVIVATSTPTHIFPATACIVQDYLGASRAGAFDLSAACSGFVYGMTMAASAIQSGTVQNAVVIGSEVMSRAIDWTDRATCILFGDGAGAIVLQKSSVPGGVLSTALRSDGSGGNLLTLPKIDRSPAPVIGMEPSRNGQRYNVISMNGKQVFRFATRVIVSSIHDALAKAELELDDISLIVPHQANVRIIDSAAKKLKVEPERFYVNVDRVGNTSAASIPIALSQAVEDGRLKPNDNVLFVGFGGGLTWGAMALKWDVTPPEISAVDQRLQQARYVWARSRSGLRRFGRRLGAGLSRSPNVGARLKDAEK